MNSLFDLATVEAPFFEPLVGQRFQVEPADPPATGRIELELVQVLALHHRGGSTARAPFSLMFKPAEAVPLSQGSYFCTGAGLDRDLIFLVPVRDAFRGLCLEAVFN